MTILRTTGSIWTKHATKLASDFFSFSSANQRNDIIICTLWFELVSQVSDVAHMCLLLYVLYDGPVQNMIPSDKKSV